MSRLFIYTTSILSVISIGVGLIYWSQPNSARPVDSKENNSIYSGCITPDGYIDFFKAYNNRISNSVPLEENAAYDLMLSVGVRHDETPEDLFAMKWELLVDSLPDDDPRKAIPENHSPTVDFNELIHTVSENWDDSAHDDMDASEYYRELQFEYSTTPWTPDKSPLLVEWIGQNETSLARFETGAKLNKFGFPIIPFAADDTSQDNQDLTEIQNIRSAARCMSLRAMLHLGQGNVEACQDDIHTIRRVGSLITQNGSLVQCLVGLAIDGIAFRCERGMIQDGNLTMTELKRYRNLITDMPPAGTLSGSIDFGERMMALSGVQQSHQDNGMFDVNIALARVNEAYDDLAGAAKLPQDIAAAERHDERMRNLESVGRFRFTLFDTKARTEIITDRLLCTYLPAWEMVGESFLREETQTNLTLVAIAIESFKLKNENYPQSLKELIEHTPEGHAFNIDDELNNGQPFLYRVTNDGYILYSVGHNKIDDDGFGIDDDYDRYDKIGDDIRIHTGTLLELPAGR